MKKTTKIIRRINTFLGITAVYLILIGISENIEWLEKCMTLIALGAAIAPLFLILPMCIAMTEGVYWVANSFFALLEYACLYCSLKFLNMNVNFTTVWIIGLILATIVLFTSLVTVDIYKAYKKEKLNN